MQVAFVPIIVVAVMSFLGLLVWAAHRGKPQADVETHSLSFRHSLVLRGFALFAGFGIPLAITVLVFFQPPKNEGDVWAIVGLYGLFAVLSGPLLWESMRFGLTLTPEGMLCRSPWRGQWFIFWDEVEEVSYSAMNSWFIIRSSEGWKFRVSLFVPGLSQFLEQCEMHLPPAVLAGARQGYVRVGRMFPGPQNVPDYRTKWNPRNKLSLVLLALLPAAAQAETPKLLKPTNLAVNTKADEDDPHVSSNGLRLYYASNASGKFDILVSTRGSANQDWRPGKLTDDLAFIRTKGDDRSVFVTTEGRYPQYLYYASKEKDGKETNFDIYVATKVLPGADRAFQEVRAVTAIGTPADELHPWLTADGKSLYFSRKTKEGWRVFVATRKTPMGPQGFDEPVQVSELPANFHHATLTPDGKTMYLQGPLDKGRWGLFVCTRGAKGWSMPEALEMLNHPEGPTGDKSPCLSRDGTRLYFASDRPGGKGGLDLYVIQTAQLIKKK